MNIVLPRKMLLLLFAVMLALGAFPAMADSLDNAASSWAEQIAGESSEDFLRKLEKDIPIERNARDALKGAVKSFITSQVKDRLIPGNISQAMATILQSIPTAIDSHRTSSPCELAAIKLASSAFTIDRTSYSLRGALNTFPEVLGGAAGGAGLVRNLGAAVVDRIRAAVEKAIDDYLADYRVETFSETWSFGLDCAVTVKVVWLKHKGEFHFLLLGDCGCNEIRVRGRRVQLSRWSISGKGRASWIGEEAERRNAQRVDPQSTLSGAVVIPQASVKVRAVCCNEGTPPAIDPALDPWRFDPATSTPRPRTGDGGQSTPRPVTGGTQQEQPPPPRTRTPQEVLEESRGIQDPTGALPRLPTGPVCPEDKDRLIRQAFDAWQVARDRLEIAQADLERLEGAVKDGETVGSEQLRQAREAVKAAAQHEEAARRVRDGVELLETSECPDKHSGLAPDQTGSGEGHAFVVAIPERCVGTWYNLESGQNQSTTHVSISYPELTIITKPEEDPSQDGQIPVCVRVPSTMAMAAPVTTPAPEKAPSSEIAPTSSATPTDAPPAEATPPVTTAEIPQEPSRPEEPAEPDPDFGLVKATEQVVQLALSSAQTGEPVTGATVKLLAPAPDLPTGDPAEAALASADNYREDVPATSVDEAGMLELGLVPTGDSGQPAELILVEAELELEEEGTAADETAVQPRQVASAVVKRVIAIDTEPPRQMIVAGNQPMASLPANLLPASSRICMNRAFLIGETPVFVLEVPEPEVAAFTERLGASEAVSFFEPDPCRTKQFNDPYFNGKGLWGQDFDDQWAIRRVNIDADKLALKETSGTRPVTVAVIDTGIDWYHPDLPHTKLWRNPDEVPGNGKDDDGNGYVDDVIGWNFVRPGQLPWDYDGHGTFVAGVIAAEQDNDKGIAGINPHARIMVLKALDPFGRGHASMIAEAITYAANEGAEIINLSLGGRGLTSVERLAVKHARAKGAIVVVAAGNDGVDISDYSPAGLEDVITVTATDRRDRRAGFSNWGAFVDIAAPGVDVLSLRARRTDLLSFIPGVKYTKGEGIVGEDRAYFRGSGTSFAAPIVAGTLSLLLSNRPELTADQAVRMVLQSARDIETPGVDNYTGYGLLDAEAALKAAPDYFLEARIHGVKVIGGNAPALRVIATIEADQFDSAVLMLGKGDDPEQWLQVKTTFTKEVNQAPLVDLPAKFFSGSKTWTLRLVGKHKNGQKREARFKVTLG